MIKTLKLWLHNLLAVLQVSCSLGVSYLLSRFHLKLWPPTVTACFCPCSQTPLLHNCPDAEVGIKRGYKRENAQWPCSKLENLAKCFKEQLTLNSIPTSSYRGSKPHKYTILNVKHTTYWSQLVYLPAGEKMNKGWWEWRKAVFVHLKVYTPQV